MTVPIQLQRMPRKKKPVPKRALLFLSIAACAITVVASQILLSMGTWLWCVVLVGCSAQAADAPTITAAADLKRAAAGVWACPGMHAEWLDAQTVQCLKERP